MKDHQIEILESKIKFVSHLVEIAELFFKIEEYEVADRTLDRAQAYLNGDKLEDELDIFVN